MRNGKVIFIKNGRIGSINKLISAKSGTKCMTNGTCIAEKVLTVKFKEGENGYS